MTHPPHDHPCQDTSCNKCWDQAQPRSTRLARFLTVSEAAARWEVSTRTVRKWIARGRVAHIKTPGGHYRIPASETQLAGGPTQEGTR